MRDIPIGNILNNKQCYTHNCIGNNAHKSIHPRKLLNKTKYSLLSKNIATLFMQLFFPVTYIEICRKPTKGWLVTSESTISKLLVGYKSICTKINTLNRDEIIHNLNSGKISSLFSCQIFCDFHLGEIIKHCVMGHTKLFGKNGNGSL